MRESIEILSYFDTEQAHSHHHTQIVIPLKGGLVLDVENNQSYLQQGQACLISTEHAHTHLAQHENSCLILNDLSCWNKDIICPESFVTLTPQAQSYLPFLSSLASTDINPQIKEQALRLVEFLLPIPQETVYQCDRRLEKAITLIDKSYHESWTIEALAEQVHLSQSQLTILFKQHMGVTPKQYLLKRRLQQAKHLLESSNKSLENIALAVGFHDASALNRFFLKHIGATPGRYRATCH